MNELINDPKATIIDVRSEGEFSTGHVAGSINLSDLLTKALPAKEHASLAPLHIHYPPSSPSLP